MKIFTEDDFKEYARDYGEFGYSELAIPLDIVMEIINYKLSTTAARAYDAGNGRWVTDTENLGDYKPLKIGWLIED